MGEVILISDVKKEPGFLYYVTYTDEGYIQVCRTKAGRPRKE